MKTRIGGYSANSTECSDHSLKKYEKSFFFKLVSLFLRGVIKGFEQKTKTNAYLTDIVKQAI